MTQLPSNVGGIPGKVGQVPSYGCGSGCPCPSLSRTVPLEMQVDMPSNVVVATNGNPVTESVAALASGTFLFSDPEWDFAGREDCFNRQTLAIRNEQGGHVAYGRCFLNTFPLGIVQSYRLTNYNSRIELNMVSTNPCTGGATTEILTWIWDKGSPFINCEDVNEVLAAGATSNSITTPAPFFESYDWGTGAFIEPTVTLLI